MYEDSYIKLYRKMMEWKWYKNGNTFRMLVHLILKANVWDAEFENIIVHRGQLVTSIQHLSQELGISQQATRSALTNLKSTSEVTSTSTSRYSVITIVKYEEYQGNKKRSTSTSTSRATNEQQASNKPTTNQQQQYKNTKNNKNIKNESVPPVFLSLGVYENVKLTAEDYEKWKAERPNDYKEKIERLSAVMKAKGTKYADHLATLRLWALEDDDKKKETVKESPKYRKLE